MDNRKLEYYRKYNLDRYYRIRKLMFEILGQACSKCFKPASEIDHINPKEKSFDLSSSFAYSKEKVLNELKKCQPLCRDCHKEKTITDRGFKTALGTHGTLSSYKYCHCELCKKAKRDYARTRRAQLK